MLCKQAYVLEGTCTNNNVDWIVINGHYPHVLWSVGLGGRIDGYQARA